MKPILPNTPSRSTDMKTSRNNLNSLKPAEDFFFCFSFPPFPLNSFFLSVPLSFFYSFFLPSFTCFIPSSCLLLFILLNYVKIPSCLRSFLIPSSFLPFLFYSLFPSFPSSFFCPPSSCSTDRKTRTNLTGLKPAEDFFFFFPPSPQKSFFLSVLLSFFFIPSSFHPLPFLFLLPAFFYLFLCFNFC